MGDAGAEHTILVVEDDPALALGLQDALDFEGYRVLHTASGQEGLKLASTERPHCIILDLMLPDINGYRVCEEIRSAGGMMPIIMLTARDDEGDKIRGLDAGADDYVAKPFSIGELLARVRAMLRRQWRSDARPEPFRIGDALIDPRTQSVTRGDETTALGSYELELLKLLHQRAGEIVSRDEILDRVWGARATPTNRTVDNFIVKLRRKIEPQPEQPQHILTVYGAGYRLVP